MHLPQLSYPPDSQKKQGLFLSIHPLAQQARHAIPCIHPHTANHRSRVSELSYGDCLVSSLPAEEHLEGLAPDGFSNPRNTLGADYQVEVNAADNNNGFLHKSACHHWGCGNRTEPE